MHDRSLALAENFVHVFNFSHLAANSERSSDFDLSFCNRGKSCTYFFFQNFCKSRILQRRFAFNLNVALNLLLISFKYINYLINNLRVRKPVRIAMIFVNFTQPFEYLRLFFLSEVLPLSHLVICLINSIDA